MTTTKLASPDPIAIQAAWAQLEQSVGPLSAIRSKREYERKVKLLNSLIDAGASDERHALAGLLDLLGELVSRYESREPQPDDAPPSDVLRLLIEANGMSQADLAAELGGQPVVSAVLNGKRAINARQAKALALRFRVSPAVFI